MSPKRTRKLTADELAMLRSPLFDPESRRVYLTGDEIRSILLHFADDDGYWLEQADMVCGRIWHKLGGDEWVRSLLETHAELDEQERRRENAQEPHHE